MQANVFKGSPRRGKAKSSGFSQARKIKIRQLVRDRHGLQLKVQSLHCLASTNRVQQMQSLDASERIIASMKYKHKSWALTWR
jgi:hypothetical protein